MHLQVDYNQKMKRCYVQLKVADIHNSLMVKNLIDVHTDNYFYQEIRCSNYKNKACFKIC